MGECPGAGCGASADGVAQSRPWTLEYRQLMIAAIVGAGPLATALASTLAARGRVRHIRLIDDAATVAAGKALDVRQSTPVLGTDVAIDATADLAARRGRRR